MKKFALGLMVLCLFSTTHVFAFWSVLFPSNFTKVNCSLEIGKFNNAFCPWKDIFVVDDDFKQEFMFFNGTTWKFQSEIWKDEQKINYLRQITKTYKFIKTDLIYAVISEDTHFLTTAFILKICHHILGQLRQLNWNMWKAGRITAELCGEVISAFTMQGFTPRTTQLFPGVVGTKLSQFQTRTFCVLKTPVL